MRLASVLTVKSPSTLAQDILDERGRVLLSRGTALTPKLTKRLLNLGITSVCIEDARTEDIIPNDFVSIQTRSRLLEAIYTTLIELGSTTAKRFVRTPKIRQRFLPLLDEVLAQLRHANGAGLQLGTAYLSDGELYHHSLNVTFFALYLGVTLGFPEPDLIDLGIGTLLHDVGKLKVSERVLGKPGRLTPDEFEQIKLHASYGYEILRRLDDVSPASGLIALEHHERFDGSGYPKGLRGREIHQFSRVTGVADVYEALTANRVYRKGYLPHQAFELLLGSGGSQFDPSVIDAFVRTITVYPVGMTLLLSTGERAVVTRAECPKSHRPVVRIIESKDGRAVEKPWELDLGTELTTEIVGC